MTYTVHCICTMIEHEKKYDMKKMYSIRDIIYVTYHKNIKGKIENTYIL